MPVGSVPRLQAAAFVILAAGFLILFINGGARFAVGLTLKPIVDGFGWGRSDIGLAVALFQWVSAAAMFAAGYLADRASPRLVLSGGLAIAALGVGLMSVISAPWHAHVVYGVIFALGNGAASLIPVSVMVSRAFPVRTGIANAVVISGMSVGQLVVIATLTAVMLSMTWQSVYVWLGIAHLVLVPLVLFAIPKTTAAQAKAARPAGGMSMREAARTRQFWLLLMIYGICGLNDFFVSTHVVAFAQDRGIDAFVAGNLLALMGLTALLGVMIAGAMSDRSGPMWPTALSFIARIAAFCLIMVDQSTLSVVIFGLIFGLTFMVTAPLTVLFVRESFGARHLGALTGVITFVHQIFGGLGAYFGAALFDQAGNYQLAFVIMMGFSVLAVVLTFMLHQPARAARQ